MLDSAMQEFTRISDWLWIQNESKSCNSPIIGGIMSASLVYQVTDSLNELRIGKFSNTLLRKLR